MGLDPKSTARDPFFSKKKKPSHKYCGCMKEIGSYSEGCLLTSRLRRREQLLHGAAAARDGWQRAAAPGFEAGFAAGLSLSIYICISNIYLGG